MSQSLLPENYNRFLLDLKDRIRAAQIRAALSVNRELVLLYWELGQEILARQSEVGWGGKVIDRLAQDLKLAFPQMQGFSSRNLKYMRKFAEAYPDLTIVQGVLAQITWYHNIAFNDDLAVACEFASLPSIEQLEQEVESLVSARCREYVDGF